MNVSVYLGDGHRWTRLAGQKIADATGTMHLIKPGDKIFIHGRWQEFGSPYSVVVKNGGTIVDQMSWAVGNLDLNGGHVEIYSGGYVGSVQGGGVFVFKGGKVDWVDTVDSQNILIAGRALRVDAAESSRVDIAIGGVVDNLHMNSMDGNGVVILNGYVESGFVRGTVTQNGVTYSGNITIVKNVIYKDGEIPPEIYSPEITVTTPVTLSGTASQQITAIQLTATVSDGGTPTFIAQNIPTGLSCSSSGKITGTPTAAGSGSFPVTVSYTGADNKTITVNYTIAQAPATPVIQVTTPASVSGIVDSHIATVQLRATVSDGGTPTFTAQNIPVGLSCSSSGQISGVPTASGGGTFEVAVSYPGAVSKSITVNYSIGEKPVITVTTPVALEGEPKKAISLQLSANVSNYGTPTFEALNPPDGLVCNRGGLISWTPPTTCGGSFEVLVSYSGADNKTIVVNYAIMGTGSGGVGI